MIAMQGHTNRATINQRRPLTENMIGVLRSIRSRDDQMHALLFDGEMTPAEQNAARALFDRGMIEWDNGMRGWFLKDAGRAVLSR